MLDYFKKYIIEKVPIHHDIGNIVGISTGGVV